MARILMQVTKTRIKVEDYWKKKLAEIFENYFDDYLPPAYHKN